MEEEKIDKKIKIAKWLKRVVIIVVVLFIAVSIASPIINNVYRHGKGNESLAVNYAVSLVVTVAICAIIAIIHKKIRKDIDEAFATAVFEDVSRKISSFRHQGADNLQITELYETGLTYWPIDDEFYTIDGGIFSFTTDRGEAILAQLTIDNDSPTARKGYIVKKKISKTINANVLIRISEYAFDFSHELEREEKNAQFIMDKDGSNEIYSIEINPVKSIILPEHLKNIFTESWANNEKEFATKIEKLKKSLIVDMNFFKRFEILELAIKNNYLYVKYVPMNSSIKNIESQSIFDNMKKETSRQIVRAIELAEKISDELESEDYD